MTSSRFGSCLVPSGLSPYEQALMLRRETDIARDAGVAIAEKHRQKAQQLRSKVATGMANLLRIKLAEAISKEDVDSLVPYFKQVMTETLLATDSGTYCHDGGNLLEDTLDAMGFTERIKDDLKSELWWLSDEITYELDGYNCAYCNDTNFEE